MIEIHITGGLPEKFRDGLPSQALVGRETIQRMESEGFDAFRKFARRIARLMRVEHIVFGGLPERLPCGVRPDTEGAE